MEPEFRLKDFTDIYALCSRRADSFCLIGDHFCQIFRGRDVVSLCLTLIACYQECETVLFVTQRLIIVYLIYRLKDIGRLDDELVEADETSEIRNHPFLLIFVKLYSDYCSNGSANADNKNGVLHLLGNFPKITPQEAQFVGRILTESTASLKVLFRMSPTNVADKAISKMDVSISEHLNYVESQLSRFRVFGREGVQDNRCDAKGSLPNVDQAMLSHYARIVYSLVPPPFVRIEPSVMSPTEDEFRFIYPVLFAPEPVMEDWLRDEEWKTEKMRPIEKAPTIHKLSFRASAPSSPASHRKQRQAGEANDADSGVGQYVLGASPILDAILLQSSNNLSKSLNNRPSAPPISLPKTNDCTQVLMPREHAVDYLSKLTSAGSKTSGSLSKSEVNRLLLTVSEDPDIFNDVCIGDYFADLVELYPDLAAELLLFELKNDKAMLSKNLDALLGLQFSVQSLVTVNKFISNFQQLEIPSDFLNRFITHCMAACDQKSENSLLTHRLVRMVCVFFTTLIRLKGFNSKSRLTEMQNFALIFLALKEASNLYQTILQIE